jgi:hypothetical protein
MSGPKHKPTVKSVSLSRTKGEWDYILSKVSERGKKNLSAYILSEINKLKNDFNDCPCCVTPASGIKIEKRPYISVNALAELEPLSIKMNKPISSIIDEFIIAPLLQLEKG